MISGEVLAINFRSANCLSTGPIHCPAPSELPQPLGFEEPKVVSGTIVANLRALHLNCSFGLPFFLAPMGQKRETQPTERVYTS